MAYAIKRIDKQPCRNSEETEYRWLIHTLTGNETKCHDMFRMKPRVFFQLYNVYNIHMDFNTRGKLD
jgi:hypothetical protein